MPTTTAYNFLVSSLKNQRADTASLKAEIEKPDSGVVVQLHGIPVVTVVSDVPTLVVTFKDVLPADQETALNAVVAAHEGDPSDPQPDTVELAHTKTTEDHRLQVSNQSYPRSHATQFGGRGDDVAAGIRSKGPLLQMQAMAAGDHSFEWQYIDCMFIWGGELWAWGGGVGDYIEMNVIVPSNASLLTATPGTGNVNLVPSGLGNNIIIPAPLGDGSHTFDLTSALNANLANKPFGHPTKVTKASPTPASTLDIDDNKIPNGFWNWNETTGEFSVAMGPAGEKLGMFNFFDSDMPINAWVVGMPLADPFERGIQWEQDVPSSASAALPHWKFVANLHLENAPANVTDGVIVSWLVNVAREYTN